MGSNSQKEDREKIMLETRETRLLLWDLLRLRYPRWELTERLIPADEIVEELTQALNGPAQRQEIYLQEMAAAEAMAPAGNSSRLRRARVGAP